MIKETLEELTIRLIQLEAVSPTDYIPVLARTTDIFTNQIIEEILGDYQLSIIALLLNLPEIADLATKYSLVEELNAFLADATDQIQEELKQSDSQMSVFFEETPLTTFYLQLANIHSILGILEAGQKVERRIKNE